MGYPPPFPALEGVLFHLALDGVQPMPLSLRRNSTPFMHWPFLFRGYRISFRAHRGTVPPRHNSQPVGEQAVRGPALIEVDSSTDLVSPQIRWILLHITDTSEGRADIPTLTTVVRQLHTMCRSLHHVPAPEHNKFAGRIWCWHYSTIVICISCSTPSIAPGISLHVLQEVRQALPQVQHPGLRPIGHLLLKL